MVSPDTRRLLQPLELVERRCLLGEKGGKDGLGRPGDIFLVSSGGVPTHDINELLPSPFFFFLLRPWLPFNIHNTCQEKKRLYHGFLSKKIKNYYPGEKFGIIN